MDKSNFKSLRDLALGTDPHNRSRVLMSMQVSAIYLGSLVLISGGSLLGVVPVRFANLLLVIGGLGFTALTLTVRLRLDERINLPAIGAVQIGFTFVSQGFGYVYAPDIRGVFFMMAPMALLFSAFLPNARHGKRLGYLAAFIFSVAILTVAGQAESETAARAQYLLLVFALILLPATGMFAGVLGAIRRRAKRQNLELQAALERNRILATIDELTGLPNRRCIDDALERIGADSRRRNTPFFICMVDLDHFKRINDQHGHSAGDTVLRTFAQAASEAVRVGDMVGRWGGEEFLIVIPDTQLDGALGVIERVRERLAAVPLWQTQPALEVTFSAGLGSPAATESHAAFLSRVDAALYAAKASGRNRTVVVDAGESLARPRDDRQTASA